MHNMEKNVETTAGGVGSGCLNKCLISGFFEYNAALSFKLALTLADWSSKNDKLMSANFHRIGFSINESETMSSTVYRPPVWRKFFAFVAKSFIEIFNLFQNISLIKNKTNIDLQFQRNIVLWSTEVPKRQCHAMF